MPGAFSIPIPGGPSPAEVIRAPRVACHLLAGLLGCAHA